MHITALEPENAVTLHEVAKLLVEGFAPDYPAAWPNISVATEEVQASFADGRLSRVALDEDGTVLGWIGAISQYEGRVWELHPLVVRVDKQQQGIGRALVADLEEQVKARGGLTIMLGTDDESGRTTLSDVNLFTGVSDHIASIQNLNHHPYEFYQKLGYIIVGVIPDANGLGKPDILMAKSMVRPHQPLAPSTNA
ncbi:aminoglycoside N-acetyltransferase AAC(6')-Ii [Dictyobacter alpinus]|uniref:Aminoglycoside N-acetyltransferase AAC(6')-Ii n=1 Tax=Dictyobacter alpinus TaxID=2014873 RepID=A0A402BC48_9CHLR|nr:GNAT family N-acetyltransferase [Dictyobacter alpinus]GCE28935.1 aminoglycoside N-acetyltransferase AAC(6')-Ii [Dictyobacter alpinus]